MICSYFLAFLYGLFALAFYFLVMNRTCFSFGAAAFGTSESLCIQRLFFALDYTPGGFLMISCV